MIKYLTPKLKGLAFLLAGFLSVLPGATNANIIGAELRYELVEDSLIVYLNTFDDYAFGRSARIDQNFLVSSLNSSKSLKAQFKKASTTDITATCASSCTNYVNDACDNSNTIVKTLYKASVSIAEFSSNECELGITWSTYYRPNLYDKYYLEAFVNRCIDGNNASPEFDNNPYHIIPFNEPYSYSWSASDKDGDSLIYELIEARTSKSSDFNYPKGRNHKIPFEYYGAPNSNANFPKGFHFNTNNGLLRFYPTQTSSAPVVVKVTEYRNASKIGESIREVYMEVKNVSNSKPILSGINGGNKEAINACVGQELCFYVQADDKNTNDEVDFTWETDIPNISISQNKKNESILDICWTALKDNLNEGPYFIKVFAKDNSCELEGRYERIFQINVTPPFDASFESTVSACQELTVNAKTDTKNSRKFKYEWQIGDEKYYGKSIKFNFENKSAVTPNLLVTNEFNGCFDSVKRQINLPELPNVSIVGEPKVCSGSNLELTATGARQYDWIFDNVVKSGSTIDTVIDQNKTLILKGADKYGCLDFDTVEIEVLEPLINAFALEKSICKGMAAKIKADGAHSYTWSKSGLESLDENTAIYRFTRNETIEVEGTDANGCFGIKKVEVVVDQDCVWPGDINGDEYVDNRDVLQLGLAYSAFDLTDENIYRSPVWMPFKSTDWEQNFNNNRNYKHADANNDGLVDYEDLLIIDKFYNREISYTNKKNNKGYKLYFDFDVDSLKGKEIIEVSISLGTQNEPAKDIYGIAFTIDYNNFVDTSSITFNTKNSWLADGANTIKLVKNIPSKNSSGGGKIDIAYTRTGKKPKSGSGKVGSVKFVVQDDIDWKKDQFIELLLESVEIINEKGEKIDGYGGAASIEINNLTSGVNSKQLIEGLSAYPNPVVGNTLYLNIDKSFEHARVSIINLTGETILPPTFFNSGIQPLHIEMIKNGYYMLVFATEQGKYVTPLVIK